MPAVIFTCLVRPDRFMSAIPKMRRDYFLLELSRMWRLPAPAVALLSAVEMAPPRIRSLTCGETPLCGGNKALLFLRHVA
jgi:hypothetical protein